MNTASDLNGIVKKMLSDMVNNRSQSSFNAAAIRSKTWLKCVYKKLFFSLVIPLSTVTVTQAQELSLPAWHSQAMPVLELNATHLVATKQLNSQLISTVSTQKALSTQQAFFNSSTAPEALKELVRGLRNDPGLIYNFVKDEIEIEFTYGAKKGPLGTFLDRSGNVFDQVDLLVNLLEIAGFDASYRLVNTTLNGAALANWFKVDIPNGIGTDWNQIGRLLSASGVTNVSSGSSGYTFRHLVVNVTINSTEYLLDPSLKTHNRLTSNLSLATSMDFNKTEFLSAAKSGVSINRSGLRSELDRMAGELETHLKANYDTSSFDEALGGWQINQTNSGKLVDASAHISGNYGEWEELPAQYLTTLRIQHQGIDQTFDSREIYTKRLSIYYPTAGTAPQPTLYLDGQSIQVGAGLTRGNNSPVIFKVNDPNPVLNGNLADQTWEQQLTSGGAYTVINTWGRIGKKHIAYQNEQMAKLLQADLAETSEALQNQSFMLIGQNWSLNVAYTKMLESKIKNDQKFNHHLVGVAGTKDVKGMDGGPYIDLGGSYAGGSSGSFGSFVGNGLLASAFEHGVIEQTQPFSAVSTVKLLDLASRGDSQLYFADSSNWLSDVRDNLQNYSAGELASVELYINDGYTIMLPKLGSLKENPLDDWAGVGFVAIRNTNDNWGAGYIISGGYKGGFSTSSGAVSRAGFGDGVSYANAYGQYQKIDMSTGSGVNQINFSRNYDSSRLNQEGDFSKGWRHNFNYKAVEKSNITAATGAGTPLNATAALVSTYVVTQLLAELDNGISGNIIDTVGISAGIYYWFMEELTENAVKIFMPNGAEEFIRLPTGKFSAQPASRSRLTGTSFNTYQLSMKHGTSLRFNSDGKVDDITDRNGNTVTIAYSGNELSTITNDYGRSLSLGYSGGVLESVTDENNRSIYYQYTGGELTGFTNSLSQAFTYGYDSEGRLNQVFAPENPTSALFTKIYDTQNRVTSQISSVGETYSYYYADGYRTEIIDALGKANVMYMNDDLRMVKRINAIGTVTENHYDGIGRLLRTDFANGSQLNIGYDGQDNPTRVTRKAKTGSSLADIIEIKGYTTFGNVKYHINAENHRTDFSYDTRGNLETIEQPNVNGVRLTATNSYIAGGLLEYSTSPNGVKTKYEYYTAGMANGSLGDVKKQVIDPDDGGRKLTTEYTYWPTGDVKTVKDSLLNTTTYTYDTARRLTKEARPLGIETSILYDKNGRPDKVSQKSGDLTLHPTGWAVTEYDYYLDDNIKTVKDPAGDTTTFTYDPMGNRKTVTDAELKVSQILYDDLYRPLYEQQKVSGIFKTTKAYTYNADDDLVDSLTDANNNVTEYDYDGFNRADTVTYPDDSTATYTYYADSQVKTMTARNSVVTTYQYDANNQVTEQLVGTEEKRVFVIDKYTGLQDKIKHYVPASATEAQTQIIDYDYDTLGRVDKVTNADNRIIAYGYDELSRPETLTYPDNKVVTYRYDNANRIDKVLYENAEIVDYEYSKLSQITAITNANGTSSVIAYENDGDVLSLNHNFTGKTLGYSYHHHKNGQRKDKSYLGEATYWSPNASFVQGYTSNELNQYDAAGGNALGYDDNGNLNATNYTLTHNSLNQLKRLTATGMSGNINYSYDGVGRRASKNAWGTATEYVYDGNHAIAEYNASGDLTQRFIYAPGIDRPLVIDIFNTRYFYHADELGSIVAVSDAAGQLQEQYSYGPFGQSDDISVLGNPLRYAARRLDDETGYYYYRARYYDPEYGRFLQADPLGYGDGMNMYAYVGNDPVNMVDPFGTLATKGGFSTIQGSVDTSSTAFVPILSSMLTTSERDNSDVKFTYGLQGSANIGLTKLIGAKFDVDFGSYELSLLTGRKYANESYSIAVDVLGFSFGLDATRNRRIRDFNSSVSSALSSRDFIFKPVFSTSWGVSSKEFWQINFGVSALLGIEGTLDFGQ